MENAVTLYIQGHGLENIKVPFNNKNNVQLLSFVGKPGVSGDLAICEYYNNQPIDKVVIYYLQKNMTKMFNDHDTLNNQEQNIFFSESKDFLKDIHQKCDITYDDGFTETYPVSERYFFFEPNQHENCRLCSDPDCFNENTKRFGLKNITCPQRCLTERNEKKIYCPEYGLSIVSSSFPQDERFTLAGNGYSERLNANINMKLSNKTYWKNRASNEYKYLVDQIYNKKEITLTELTNLFQSMGFKYIYILDPTCRECDIPHNEVEQYVKTETTKPSNRTIMNSNTESIYTSQHTNSFLGINQNTINKNSNSFVQPLQECINGICKIFPSKSKVDGGKTKRIKRKVFKKRRTNNKKRKTLVSKKRKTIKKRVKNP